MIFLSAINRYQLAVETITYNTQLNVLFTRFIKKSLSTVIGPALLLGLVYWINGQSVRLHPVLMDVVKHAPFVLIVMGLALSWRFNRSRAFFMLLLVGFGYWVLVNYMSRPVTDSEKEPIYAFVSILVPLNIGLFIWFREQGVFSNRGFLRMVIIGVQVGAMAWLMKTGNIAKAEDMLFQYEIQTEIFNWFNLPQLSVLIFSLVLLLAIFRFIGQTTAVNGGIIVGLAATLLGLNGNPQSLDSILYFSTTAIIILVAVIQDSYVMAYHDELTGLPGRRAMNERLMRLGDQYTIVMVDIDHFKKFNDSYGHDIGDQVLRFVAGKLEAVRGGGKAYRYGGEEFAILYPGKIASDIFEHLERVHDDIGKSEFVVRAKNRPRTKPESKPDPKSPTIEVRVTVSIGAANRTDIAPTPHEVFKAADKALYRAKQAGRNQIWI